MLLFKNLEYDLNDNYDLNKLLISYYHLLSIHEISQKTKQYFIKQIGICPTKSTKCKIFNHYLNNKNDSTLCLLHCCLLHCNDDQLLLSKKYKDRHNRYCINSTDLGINVLNWLKYDEKPMFNSFKDEILKNEKSIIDDTLWEILWNQSIIKSKNIEINCQFLNVEDIMCLKLYSDYNINLRDSFLSQSYYWSSLLLYKIYLYAAKPIKHTIYYGSSWICDSKNRQKYHGPLSVTLNKDILSPYFNDDQIVSLNNNKGINLDWITSYHFKNENQVLLFDEIIYLSSDHKQDNHDDLMNKTDHLMMSLSSSSIDAVDNDKRLIPYIKKHYLLFAPNSLNLLVNKYKMKQLKNVLTVFLSKFKLLSVHYAFNYCSYKINIDCNNKLLNEEFKNYKYKIRKEKGSEYILKYDDELVIKENGTYNIYITNCDIKYYLLQTIICNKFRNDLFYADLCKKFKLIHNDTILKLKHSSKIPTKYHSEILNAKFLLRICNNHKKENNDQYGKNKNYYKFDKINEINMILPFVPNYTKCDLYVQPQKHHQFVFLAKIQFNHENTMSSKLNHLFCLLKYYNKNIKKPERFPKRFNFNKKQVENEFIPNLIKHKDLLYYMAKTKLSIKKEYSVYID